MFNHLKSITRILRTNVHWFHQTQPPTPFWRPGRAGWAAAALAAWIGLSGLAYGGQPALSVTNGLALWLRADAGVTTNAAGAVVSWTDQSGSGNNAGPLSGSSGSDMPLLVTKSVFGTLPQPVVQFDGSTSVLEIPNSPSMQPGMSNWTVIFVAKRLPGSGGDFPVIIGSRPWTAAADLGWAVSFYIGNGVLGSQLSDGSMGHDVSSKLSASPLSADVFQIWQVEESRDDSTTTYYKNGALDNSLPCMQPSASVNQTVPVYLGRDTAGGGRRAAMDLKEVLVYNRVLTEAERQSITNYLGYAPMMSHVPPTVSLIQPTNNTVLSAPAEFILTAQASSSSSNGSIQKVDFCLNNGVVATAFSTPYTVRISMPQAAVGNFTLTAVATDELGYTSTSAPVAITISGSQPPASLTVTDGLALWLRSDAGVTTNASGAVVSWTDQSGNGNNAGPLSGGTGSDMPLLVQNAVNGHPALRFDGVSSVLEIPNSSSLQPGVNDWTVIFVGKRLPASAGDYPQIIGSRPWTAAADLGWAVCFFNGSDGWTTPGVIGSQLSDGSMGHDVGWALSTSLLAKDAFQIWQVEENRTASTTTFYKNGELDRSVNSYQPTASVNQAVPVYIGRDTASGGRRANMDLADVMIYNRTLSEQERADATAYLTGRYPTAKVLNQAPVVSIVGITNGSTFVAPTVIPFTVSATDSDGGVAQVAFYSGSTLLGVATSAPYILNVPVPVGVTDFTLKAVATDNLGATSATSPVTVQVFSMGVDYSDTFTINATRTDGLFDQNENGAYAVENSYGNPAAVWTPTSNFGFHTPQSCTEAATVSQASGNAGASSGLAQSSGGDFSIAYGLRTNYVVQFKAIFPSNRVDISSLPAAGNSITTANSLTVFLRPDTIAGQSDASFPATGLPGISLFNGSKETAVTKADGTLVLTGVTNSNWHAVAVQFDQGESLVRIYVDGIVKAQVDLNTFAGGIYKNYSNGAVGLGGSASDFWIDNFAVGAPVSLIGAVDYADTYTINSARTVGLFNDNSGGAYNVEICGTNAPAAWIPYSFTFTTPASSSDPTILGAAVGNAGASTGFIQSGGNDCGFAYGLRSNYVIQLDCILPDDRLDITMQPSFGGMFDAKALNIFLRRDSSVRNYGMAGIGIYNVSVGENAVYDANGQLVLTGVDDNNWHNFAVNFDQLNNKLYIYVDRVLKTTVDLNTFRNGNYKTYSNTSAAWGGASRDGHDYYIDNFQVGAPAAALVASPAKLQIGCQNGQVVISWSGSGTLEQAESLAGSWKSVSSQSNPYIVTPTPGQMYYRLKQ